MTYEEQIQLINKHLAYFQDKSEYNMIPERFLRAYIQWALFAYPAGHFVMATLKNDLNGAFSYADSEAVQVLQPIVKLIYNRLPSPCWRSQERIDSWEGLPDWEFE